MEGRKRELARREKERDEEEKKDKGGEEGRFLWRFLGNGRKLFFF